MRRRCLRAAQHHVSQWQLSTGCRGGSNCEGMLLLKSNSLVAIRAVALECLLEDQIREEGNDYGSWGRSTLDYCYLTTAEPRWTPGCGSITQTAWALLGLRGSMELCRGETGRLEAAARHADEYVSNYIEFFLRSPERDRSNEARNRHAATALLADLLLTEVRSERRRPRIDRLDVWDKYTGLLADLGRYLEGHGGGKGTAPSTEAALVALYPLLVRTLLHLRESRGVAGEDGILRGLVEVWRAQAVNVVASAADLLGRFDPKASPVISRPHVWAALLDVTSIVAEGEDDVGSRAWSLRSEVERDAVLGLRSVAGSPLPTCRDGSLWEPWGTLALLVQLGQEYTEWAGQVAEDILQRLSTGRPTAGSAPILGGCTHIWSILARRASSEGAAGQQPKSGLHLPAVRELVAAGKFDYRHWPRDGRVRIARDLRAFEIHEAWVRGAQQGVTPLLRRFAALYRGDLAREVVLTRNERSPCRSVLVAGYTTSGKSLAAEFLELHAGLGRVVKRVTTARWNLGEPWEKRYYEVVSNTEFDRSHDRMFGVHSLKDARFGFVTQDFQDVAEYLFRILPVGWSHEAILNVREFCRGHGEEPLIVALRPSDQILELRIRQRWGGEDVPRQLGEAKEFYANLPSEIEVIDSSGPKEEMFCRLLALLREALTLAEGCDVVVSYAGPQVGLAGDIRTALKAVGIRSFVAGADTLPSLDFTAQGNIDRVFSLVDVIVVIWSREYPMREFASYEWTTWVTEAWKRNDNRVVFVTIDDTPLPPEARTAYHLRWASAGPAGVADAVKHRLERINRSAWKAAG